jgi:hypothetical protein
MQRPTATIVVAESSMWQPGLDFGAAMRRRGHRVIRLLADGPDSPARHRRARRNLDPLVDLVVENAVNPDGSLIPYAQDLLLREQPTDWQVSELTAKWLSSQGWGRLLNYQRVGALPEPHCYDKLALTRFLEQHGVPVPQTWDSADDVPVDAPFPLMLKGRTGAGGDSVYLCRDREELLRRVADWSHPVEHFVQRAWLGGLVDVAGVAKDGEIVQAGCYRNQLNPDRPLDPSHGIYPYEDPQLMAASEALVRALRLTGPFALDAVVDDQGNPLFIDVNYRIWAAWGAMQSAGLDVLGSYEYALGLADHPGPGNYATGGYTSMLRLPPLNVETPTERATWAARQFREIAHRTPQQGLRWARFYALRVGHYAMSPARVGGTRVPTGGGGAARDRAEPRDYARKVAR